MILRNIGDITLRINELHANSIRKIAMDIDRRLVNRTPRDTGRAARNWIASINVIDSRQLDAPAEQGQANDAIKEAEQILKNIKKGQKVIIQNNLPYIQALNNGHSPQAPPGFVDAEIQAVLSQYRSV